MKRTIPTILGNVLTGGIGGFLVGLVIIVLFSISSPFNYIIFGFLSLYGLWEGYSHPRISEIWNFVVPVALLFVIIGNAFGGALNQNELYILYTSIFLLIVNIFVGDIKISVWKKKVNRAKTISYRTIGRR